MKLQEQIIIRNEEEAFTLIRQALKHELKNTPIEFKFDGWPVLEITLKGEGYEHHHSGNGSGVS